MPLIKKLFIAFFPFQLLLIEWLIRQVGGWDTINFVGPSLAATGLGLMVTVLEPKQIDLHVSQQYLARLRSAKFRLVNASDQRIMDLALWALLFGLTLWIGSLYVSTKFPNLVWQNQPLSLWLGLVDAFIGLGLYFLKAYL